MRVIALFLFFISCGSVFGQQKQGPFVVSLRLPEGGLASGEEMPIEIAVADSSKDDGILGAAPVIRASVSGVVDMPSMAGMPKIEETAYPEGIPGVYTIRPVFPHGGTYRLMASVRPPGRQSFTIEFPLEVGDRRANARSVYQLQLSGSQDNLTVRIQGPQGVVTEFETVHEKKLHLIAVRKDLEVFEHLHPELKPDGTFVLKHKWAAGGDYTLFADFAPAGRGSQVISAPFAVKGPSTGRPDRDFAFTLSALPRAGRTDLVTARMTPAMPLEPYLGAMGHLMVVSEDAGTLVHSHPTDEAKPPGEIDFVFRLPKPGKYRAWLEVQSGGKRRVARLDLEGQP
jgi:hypothetical protein